MVYAQQRIRPEKWVAQSSFGFWDTNGSSASRPDIVRGAFQTFFAWVLWLIEHTLLYDRNHKNTIIKTHAVIRTQEDFRKICSSHFIARVRKGLLKRAGDRTETSIFWPQTYGRQRCVFLVLLMLNRMFRGHSVGWWLSLRHLISIFSRPQLIRAQKPLRPGAAFPTVSRLSPSPTLLQLNWPDCVI